MDPPPVSSHLRSLILSEIQNIGPGGRLQPNSSSSLFRTHIPLDHPLSHIHTLSINTILQAISPRTLQTYWTAWSSFKIFHRAHNLVFPEFSLLSISSFITYLHHTNSIKPGSIKVYLSGIHFFYKLIHGQQCPNISNPQIFLLIKGLQKTNPPGPDTRQPLTIDFLSICLTTLHSGSFSPNKIRTLDAIFNLAFFVFLRVSEFTTNSNFNPAIHPTFSDLQVVNHDIIRFNIKTSKTDQMKRGHSIFIFNLPTPIQPYQSIAPFRSPYVHLLSQIYSVLFRGLSELKSFPNDYMGKQTR
ncbi:uncharacterized protein LOC131524061 [Onychostoma macrolepis]|uniref:uncharacterized protein LOC131524061 n=1 Tax=Onychostoma macrolepis TaxID=369639 RepID=UPI00272A0330|nr:uncharacterized protein LOC131524061 [Onychostoma macrolepis]